MAKWFMSVVVLGMAACVAPQQQTTPVEADVADNTAGCKSMIQLAKLCYATSEPDTRCSDVYTAMGSVFEKADFRPSERQALATFCGRACMMRKNGVPWSTISQAMREQCN